MLVDYEGQWQPIRTPRTGGSGRFRVVYQFHQAYGQFPFKAGVRDRQVGFPYRDGYSGAVEVVVRLTHEPPGFFEVICLGLTEDAQTQAGSHIRLRPLDSGRRLSTNGESIRRAVRAFALQSQAM